MNIYEDLSLGKLFTFEENREFPIHRWFHYKEGFSPLFVDYCLKHAGVREGTVLDPFCGVGTTALRAQEQGLHAISFDSSPLAVFVAQTKGKIYRKEITNDLVERARNILKKPFEKWNWKYELFNPSMAFPPRTFGPLLSLRANIEHEEEPYAQLFLLALLSILPQISLIKKDGGVLKVDRHKRCMPLSDAFLRRVKAIAEDIANDARTAPEPTIRIGDARKMEIEDESVRTVITSPPYLNNIDYTKVYGLELGLLEMREGAPANARAQSLRSFISKQAKNKMEAVPEEAQEYAAQIPVAGEYFSDMEQVIEEIKRVLPSEGRAYVNVANSVIHRTHIPVDEILGKIGERMGLEANIIVGAYRIADVKPTRMKVRESVVVITKN